LGIKTLFYVGFADIEESLYHFYFEFEDPETPQSTADLFGRVVDQKLREINVEYESKRASFRLKEPIAHRLINNAYSRFKAACLEEGMRDGQFKFNQLMQDENRRGKFQVLVIGDILSEMRSTVINRRIERADRKKARADRKKARGKRWEERRKKRAARRAKRRGK
jgi:hypothetical protein